jgi:hypothetical protein
MIFQLTAADARALAHEFERAARALEELDRMTEQSHPEHLYCISDTGCWIWQGKLTRGYAPYKRVYAKLRGPIPAGYDLHHLCRNTGCVNPDHLQLLTLSEHRTMHRRERGKLTLEQAGEIKVLVREQLKVSMEAIGRRYGVSSDQVERIASGKDFRELGGPVVYEVICRLCGESFETANRRKRFCKPVHRRQWHNRELVKQRTRERRESRSN